MGYECILGDEPHAASWLQTNLDTGATVSVCSEHFPVALIGGLASELGVEADRLYDAVKRFVDREAKRQADEDQAAAVAAGQDSEAAGAEPEVTA